MMLPLWRSVVARLAVGSAVGVLIVCIGLSRLYLGYHWAADVLAGWSPGLCLLAVAIAVATVWMRQSWTRSSRTRSARPRLALLTFEHRCGQVDAGDEVDE